MSIATATRPSDAQMRFIGTLIADRDCDADAYRAMALAPGFSRPAASAMINRLKSYAYRRPQVAANGAPVSEPGYYRAADGTLARVQRSKSSGNLYALALEQPGGPETRGRFVFTRGLVYRLSATDRLTREQAADLGRGMGICVKCGAELTDADSTTRGMGPVCWSRWS